MVLRGQPADSAEDSVQAIPAPNESGTIPVTARLVANPVPVLEIQPRSIGFADSMVMSRQQASQRVTIRNVGAADATVAGLTGGYNFILDRTSCALAPGASCDVNVPFFPTRSGPSIDSLTFTISARGNSGPSLVGRGCRLLVGFNRGVTCNP